jgi:tRNA(fMet)-specific endonuclease VapC
MTNPLFMLDTNIASYITRNNKPIVKERARVVPRENLCVSVLTKAELLYGVARKPEATRIKGNVFEFLSEIDIVIWDDAAAEAYGHLRTKLERRGTPIDTMDVLIAAHALSIGATLVTNDKDFRHIDGLKTEDWTLPLA